MREAALEERLHVQVEEGGSVVTVDSVVEWFISNSKNRGEKTLADQKIVQAAVASVVGSGFLIQSMKTFKWIHKIAGSHDGGHFGWAFSKEFIEVASQDDFCLLLVSLLEKNGEMFIEEGARVGIGYAFHTKLAEELFIGTVSIFASGMLRDLIEGQDQECPAFFALEFAPTPSAFITDDRLGVSASEAASECKHDSTRSAVGLAGIIRGGVKEFAVVSLLGRPNFVFEGLV